MGRRRTCVGLAATAILMVGCTRLFDIAIAGPLAAPVLTLDNRGRFSTEKVCLDRFDVSEEQAVEGGSATLVWRVGHGEPMTCPPVTTIKYGNAPQGFKVYTPPAPLKAGVVYVVDGRGSGWIGQARFVYSAGQWNRVS